MNKLLLSLRYRNSTKSRIQIGNLPVKSFPDRSRRPRFAQPCRKDGNVPEIETVVR